MRLHLLEMSEALPIKSHQYACLKNNTKGIPMWKEVSSRGINSRERINEGMLREMKLSSPGTSIPIDYSMPNDQS